MYRYSETMLPPQWKIMALLWAVTQFCPPPNERFRRPNHICVLLWEFCPLNDKCAALVRPFCHPNGRLQRPIDWCVVSVKQFCALFDSYSAPVKDCGAPVKAVQPQRGNSVTLMKAVPPLWNNSAVRMKGWIVSWEMCCPMRKYYRL